MRDSYLVVSLGARFYAVNALAYFSLRWLYIHHKVSGNCAFLRKWCSKLIVVTILCYTLSLEHRHGMIYFC